MLVSSCSKEGQEVNHDGAHEPRAMVYDFQAPRYEADMNVLLMRNTAYMRTVKI